MGEIRRPEIGDQFKENLKPLTLPPLKGESGKLYNSRLWLLENLPPKGKKRGALKISDDLINLLENRLAIYPEEEQKNLPTLTALKEIRAKTMNEAELSWPKEFSLLPFPRGPEILSSFITTRNPGTGAEEIKQTKTNKETISYPVLLVKINHINSDIKDNNLAEAFTIASDLKQAIKKIKTWEGREKNVEADQSNPTNPYERTFVDSLPELKQALLKFIEKYEKFQIS